LKLPEISGLLFVIIAAHELQLIRKDSCRWLWLPFRSVRVSLAAPVYYSVNFFSSPTLKTTEPPKNPISPKLFRFGGAVSLGRTHLLWTCDMQSGGDIAEKDPQADGGLI